MRQDRWNTQDQGHRIHIFGPSGAGTSTLGRALSTSLASQHFDTDDFYWLPTDPPFTKIRPEAERLALMQDVFLPRRDWVLSGCMDGWSRRISERFTFAIRLTLDPNIRRYRLQQREAKRCGCARGWGESICQRCIAFLTWADGYEHGDRPGRSLGRHLSFARTLTCPVLVLDSRQPVEELVAQVMQQLDQAVVVS